MLFISLIVLLTSNAFSQEKKLPELMTKQSLSNIRYLSKAGKVTYYQNRSGELKFSTNYQVQLVKTGTEQTQFLINASDDETWIGVEEIPNPHRPLPGVNLHKLYVGKFAGKNLQEAGSGVNIQFQRSDRFFTYFDPLFRKIHIKSTTDLENEKTIRIFNKTDPIFVPESFLVTDNNLVFTDINSKGQSAVLMYSLSDKKFETIYKTQNQNEKLELCYMGDILIIGEFPKTTETENSKILRLNLFNNPNFEKVELLYASKISDIGNMVCEKDKLFFIKTTSFNKTLNMRESDVAQINLKSKKLTLLSQLGDVTQLTKLSHYILAPYKGEYLIVSGQKNILDDSIKKGQK